MAAPTWLLAAAAEHRGGPAASGRAGRRGRCDRGVWPAWASAAPDERKCVLRSSYTLWLWMCELRQLRALVAVADAGHVHRRGIALGVSQAAVSRTIAALEAALGVRVLGAPPGRSP